MAGAFLYDNLLLTATSVQAAAAIASAPVGNLLDPQPRIRMRCVGVGAVVLIDLGASRPVDCLAFISTTVTAGAIARVRLSSADATGVAGDVWDSGVISAETGEEANGNVIIVRAGGPVSGRYVLAELADGALTRVDVGCIAVGALWRLARAQSYGYSEGRVIADTRDINPLTRAEFPAPALLNPRFTAFQVQVLPRADAETGREMRRRLGGVGDALWIPDLSLSQSERNKRSIWGGVYAPGSEAAHVRPLFPGWTAAWRLIERG